MSETNTYQLEPFSVKHHSGDGNSGGLMSVSQLDIPNSKILLSVYKNS